MKKGRWLVIGAVGLMALAMIVWLYVLAQGRKAEAALQEQLRLARAEGLPTTVAEFSALIKPCRPEDNAAPLYRKLKGLGGKWPDPLLSYNLIFCPDSATLRKAQAYVNDHKADYAIIDQAVQKPHCWFNRDWSLGFAVLFVEYADMKSAARLLAFRGSLEAAQGNSKAALQDIQKIQVVADNLREEPEMIARLVADADRTIAMKTLAEIAYSHPKEAKYREALKEALRAFTSPNDKLEHADELYAVLCLLGALKTVQGQASLGLKPDDVSIPLQARLIAGFISRGKSTADIVRANREMWAAYDLPPGKRDSALEKSNQEFLTALWSDPLAAKLYTSLTAGDDVYWSDHRWKMWDANHEAYTALSRALSSETVPQILKTDDLISPFDGKPLSYKFDGKQIVIAVSGAYDDESPPKPLLLKIPPDPPTH